MSSGNFHGSSWLCRLSIGGRCALLGLVVLVSLPLAVAAGWWLDGQRGVYSATIAAAVCWVCSTIALVLTARSRGAHVAMKGLLFSMFFQMGMPLIVGMLISRSDSDLAGGGILYWIVAYHLLTLAVKTLLVLPLMNPGKSTISQGA